MKAHVAPWETKVICVRIISTSGDTVRWAAYPTDLIMSNGQVYQAGSGFDWSSYSSTSSASPSNIDLQGVLNSSLNMIDRAQIETGRWDNARAYVFATSWANPLEDEEDVSLFIYGKATVLDFTWKVEFMSFSDLLGQSPSNLYSPQCQNILFDETLDGYTFPENRTQCMGPRDAPDGPRLNDYKVTGTITAVTNNYQFQDSGRSEVDDWFGEGHLMFITGANAGQKPRQIHVHTAGGQFSVYEPFYYPIAPGDQYVAIPGCRKRRDEDCLTKFDNVLNIKSHPDLPTPSQYQQQGRGR